MPQEFALDSTIVVILGGGHSAEPRALERAEGILYEHEGAGEIIGIPAAAFAECCHCEVDRRFKIWPLNAAAAMLANRITPSMLKVAKAKGCTRSAAKVDALILATAEIAGCVAIYTTDDWFDEIVKKNGLRVRVRPLPQVLPVQTTLLGSPQIDLDAAKEKPSKP